MQISNGLANSLGKKIANKDTTATTTNAIQRPAPIVVKSVGVNSEYIDKARQIARVRPMASKTYLLRITHKVIIGAKNEMVKINNKI